MCVIAIKPKGQPFPTMAEMQNCWDSNFDGFGFMYATGKDVNWNKGYLKEESFQKAYQSILDHADQWKSMSWVFHFRIATHGGKGQAMTHPFPVTRDSKEILLLSGKTKAAFAHNGILTSVPSDTVYSDTANYVRCFLSKIDLQDKRFTQYFMDETSSGSRFALLYADGSFLKAGVWKDHGGCFWSNDSYADFDYSDYYGKYGSAGWKNVTVYKGKPYNHLDFDHDDRDDYGETAVPVSGSGSMKRLPDYMMVYGSDGTIYRQGSSMLEYGKEEFWIDTDSGELHILTLSTGHTEMIDYVTDALGKEVKV
jgi:predicted glutamine amidotransferase